jgi:hypothetical protein
MRKVPVARETIWSSAFVNKPEQLVRILALFMVCNGINALVGVLQSFLDDETTVVLDKLSHASIIDGVLMAQGKSPDLEVRFFKHNNLTQLRKCLQTAEHARKMVVVEGYFDVIAPHQAGFGQVVATLGTALTTSHLTILQRLVPKVVLLFDPDPAGVNATLRTVELFLDHGMDASVATLPTTAAQ